MDKRVIKNNLFLPKPDWEEYFTLKEVNYELGINITGVGWYVGKNTKNDDTYYLLVLDPDENIVNGPEKKYRFYCWNWKSGHSPLEVMKKIINLNITYL